MAPRQQIPRWGDDSAGYPCQLCGFGATRVMDSRRWQNGWVRRRRRCEACEHRWSTVEVPTDILDTINRTRKLVSDVQQAVQLLCEEVKEEDRRAPEAMA